MPEAERLAQGVGASVARELNLDDNDYSDGVQFRTKMVEPRVTVRDYTHYTPLDKRTVCATCSHSGDPHDMRNGSYRIWCRAAFEQGAAMPWKQEPHDIKNNGCRDWLPKSLDCIG